MSQKSEETKNLEEEVVVNETTDLVTVDKEAKKAKMVSAAKKGLKIAGIAAVGGILGYFIGKSRSNSDSDYDDSDEIDVDYEIEAE